jgi:acyl-CoA thioesterase-1
LTLCQNAHSASKTILVLGDSISAEYGLPRDSGWVALLRQRCQQNKIEVNIVNASVSGDTSSGGKSRLPAALQAHQPAIVIIELGGNDGLRGTKLQETEANFRAMIRAAMAAKAKVLLLGMRLPPNYGKRYTDQFFALYGQLAEQEKTALVPFLLQGMAEKPELFQADRIHPNLQAQSILLDNVWPVLAPMLALRLPPKQAPKPPPALSSIAPHGKEQK